MKKSKVDESKKTVKLEVKHLIIVVIASVFIGYLLNSMASNIISSHDHEGDHLHKSGGHMAHEKFEVTNNIPIVNMKISEDPKGGYNIKLETNNFEFSPENTGGVHEDNKGHAHLYINDRKFTRIYSDHYFLPKLEEGDYDIRVTLNTNDHKDYAVQGAVVQDVETIFSR